MLYAQHNYSLGRSSFPFLCVCSFTSTDAFMLNKCLILVIAYRIFLHSTPPYRVGEALPCFCHPNFLFLKHRSGFSDFFTKWHVIGLMYSILDRDFFVFLILFWISVKRYLLYCCLDRNTSYFAKKNFDYYNFDAILGRHLIKCWRDLSRYF